MADSNDMNFSGTPGKEDLLFDLLEREKELTCLYAVEETLRDTTGSIEAAMIRLAAIIPDGWQFPEKTRVKIVIQGEVYTHEHFAESVHFLESRVMVQSRETGRVYIYYIDNDLPHGKVFLKEETKLINAIADRIGYFLLHKRLEALVKSGKLGNAARGERREGGWRSALRFLQTTDEALYLRISKRMVTHLSLSGVREAASLMQRYSAGRRAENILSESNEPRKKESTEDTLKLCVEIFEEASRHLPDQEILQIIQKWIREDKTSYIVKPLTDLIAPLSVVIDAMKRYELHSTRNETLSGASRSIAIVSMVQRFLSQQLEYVNVAKENIPFEYFFGLIDRIVAPPDSLGHIGGKSAGLILGECILEKARRSCPEIGQVRIPKTWYVTSDGLNDFLHYNDIEGVQEEKYKPIAEVRLDYPHIIELFKHSHFSPKMIKDLTMALDDFGEVPLVVRSSSLLEDRHGSAFSGKYKSLFIANQGSRAERTEALIDAIAEVYASTFSPDTIEYRAERGLIDFNEEMAIIIQEVVGRRVGKYYFPAWSGVAFSQNEFRWSPEIKREDGLVRLVPGLGTRAVDRLADDYPILAAPGHPGLHVNRSIDERVKYSPRYMDVINLDTRRFETRSFTDLVAEVKDEFPDIGNVGSITCENAIHCVTSENTDFEHDEVVATFKGLLEDSPFLGKTDAILGALEKAMGTPVDIEFTSDGEHFYLLQCRPQSSSGNVSSAVIPEDTPPEDVVFTASRYISNGLVPDLSHIVYVVPEFYSSLSDSADRQAVGRAIGELNTLLPKRKFMLMGPGRWGSRDDIKLGVPVTYSDINNCAMLIEIAKQKGNYIPDLSFGTHFFQDLVEASIRYLPLYPDVEGTIFNEHFLCDSKNILEQLLPEYDYLHSVIKVIDVGKATFGRVLRVLMNAESNSAKAIICDPDVSVLYKTSGSEPDGAKELENHWQWRYEMAERIGAAIDISRFPIKGFYIFGSARNACSGPRSDIDLLIHFYGNDTQRKDLESWLQGWSLALDEMNFIRTGNRCGGILDVHIITDKDIENKDSYAIKINAVTDPAQPIPLGGRNS